MSEGRKCAFIHRQISQGILSNKEHRERGKYMQSWMSRTQEDILQRATRTWVKAFTFFKICTYEYLLNFHVFFVIIFFIVSRMIVFYCPRSQDIPKRKRYVQLVDNVQENGGTVKIFSSLHVSGERKFSDITVKIFSSPHVSSERKLSDVATCKIFWSLHVSGECKFSWM